MNGSPATFQLFKVSNNFRVKKQLTMFTSLFRSPFRSKETENFLKTWEALQRRCPE